MRWFHYCVENEPLWICITTVCSNYVISGSDPADFRVPGPQNPPVGNAEHGEAGLIYEAPYVVQ